MRNATAYEGCTYVKKGNKPKIVVFDLETLPDGRAVYRNLPTFGNWPGRGFKGDIQTIMCFGYKLLGEKKTYCINAWDFPQWKKDRHNDIEVVKAAYEILKDADGIITHNGIKFDMKILNTRLKLHKLPRLPKIPHIDTKQLCSRHLALYSNRLGDVATFMGLTNKMHWSNKWDTWVRFEYKEDSRKDRSLMDKYCKYDVIVLEEVYNEMREYAANIPNYNLFLGEDSKSPVCPACGGNHLHKHGFKTTKTKKYQRYQCQNCGNISQADLKGENLK